MTAASADEVELTIESETGGPESGIDVQWTLRQRRADARVSEQELSIGAGWGVSTDPSSRSNMAIRSDPRPLSD